MENRFNFVERFAPLSSLQMTIVEFDDGRFIIAPEAMISCNLQDDHVVVLQIAGNHRLGGDDETAIVELNDGHLEGREGSETLHEIKTIFHENFS